MKHTSTGRVMWAIWCCLWAGIWIVAGLVMLGSSGFNGYVAPGQHGRGVFFLVLGVLSLAAIWLPVGSEPR
jgi:hypothetical protein